MGIVSSIRNFFYAATHANQLIAENELLTTQKQILSGKLWKAENSQRETTETLDAVRRQRDNLTSAMKILAPKDISLETLQEMYNAVYHSPSQYNRAGEQLLGNCWQSRTYFQNEPISKSIETEVYRSALISGNILPQKSTDASVINYLQNRVLKIIEAKFDYEFLAADMPIGRIDYLQPNESIEYRDAGRFISDIMHSNYYGSPMSITVYSDPKNGAHINTSWVIDMDPPPQGFHITPYQDAQQMELSQSIPPPTPEPEIEF